MDAGGMILPGRGRTGHQHSLDQITNVYDANVPHTSLVSTGSAWISQETPPVGSLVLYAGTTPPEGWEFADGSSYLKETYLVLYERLGGESNIWGTSSLYFNVPTVASPQSGLKWIIRTGTPL